MNIFNADVNPQKIVDNKLKEKIKKIINDEVVFRKFSIGEKIVFSITFKIFSIITWFFIGWALFFLRAKMWKKYNDKNINEKTPQKIYKLVFESLYSNIKVMPQKKVDFAFIKSNRGPRVPADATIVESHMGVTFKIDDIKLQTAWINWRWIRSYGRSVQIRYYPKIYLFSNDIQKQFKNLNLRFKKSHLFSKRGKDLENQEFNKEFWYDYNNAVKARVFFPVSSQEAWVNVLKNAKVKYNKLHGFELDVKDGNYLFGKKPSYHSKYGFIKSKKITNIKSIYLHGVLMNILNDITEISGFLRLAMLNKYFFK